MKISKKAVISVIGSAVLAFIVEKLLSPILEAIYERFLSIGSFFVKNFSNSVYQEISNGISGQEALSTMFIMVISFALFSPMLFFQMLEIIDGLEKRCKNILFSLEQDEKELLNISDLDSTIAPIPQTKSDSLCKMDLEQNRKHQSQVKRIATYIEKFLAKQSFILLVSIFFMTALFCFEYGKQSFVTSHVTNTTCSIEIVSPYISDQEYKQLKSDFHLIQNQTDYELLWDKLMDIADANSITLKK